MDWTEGRREYWLSTYWFIALNKDIAPWIDQLPVREGQLSLCPIQEIEDFSKFRRTTRGSHWTAGKSPGTFKESGNWIAVFNTCHCGGEITLIHMDSRPDSKTVILINLFSWLQSTSLSTQPFDPLPSIYSSSPNLALLRYQSSSQGLPFPLTEGTNPIQDEKVTAEV